MIRLGMDCNILHFIYFEISPFSVLKILYLQPLLVRHYSIMCGRQDRNWSSLDSPCLRGPFWEMGYTLQSLRVPHIYIYETTHLPLKFGVLYFRSTVKMVSVNTLFSETGSFQGSVYFKARTFTGLCVFSLLYYSKTALQVFSVKY